MSLRHQQTKNNNETLGIILAFLVLEPNTYKRTFGAVMEQVLSQITLKQYVLQVNDEGEVVGYALWARLDNWTETLFQGGLRPLHMLEYNSGNKLHVTNMGVAANGDLNALRNWLEGNLK